LVLTGTLADIVGNAGEVRPPAVLVVGDVVRYHEQLDWFIPQAFAFNNIHAEFVAL
jgi:siroheme synthase